MRPTAIERAFELARSGKFANVPEIERTMKREGHVIAELDGRALRQQLKSLIEVARGSKPDGRRRPSSV